MFGNLGEAEGERASSLARRRSEPQPSLRGGEPTKRAARRAVPQAREVSKHIPKLKGSKKGRELNFKQAFEVFFVPLRLRAFVLIPPRPCGNM